MERWLQQRGNTDAAGELLQEIQRVRQTFAATMGDRFIRLRLNRGRLVPASAADANKMAVTPPYLLPTVLSDTNISHTTARTPSSPLITHDIRRIQAC
jgi:hypothetical protein